MIDSVRNTVLSYINKDNRGYITPAQFNLFAKQAQIDIFEKYFFNYNNAINKQNQRQSGSGLNDLPKRMSEVIEKFSTSALLYYDSILLNYRYPGDNPLDPDEDTYYLLERITYNNVKEVEKVSQHKIMNLLNSNLTAPSLAYPVYVLDETRIQIYPTTISGSNILAQYIRYPRDPKWTYDSALLIGGEPIFDQSMNDYQDFELPLSDEPLLVNKILQYAGVSISEMEVVEAAKGEEILTKQEKR